MGGASVEKQLIAELEAALQQQQTAVSQGHAAVRDTIRELHQALKELEKRESYFAKTAKDLTGKAVTHLDQVEKTKSPADDHEKALEKIADLERELLKRQALEEKLEASEAQLKQLQQQLEQQAQQIVEADKAQKKLHKIEQVYKDASDTIQAGQAAQRRVVELEQTLEEYKQATLAEHEKHAALEEALETAKKSEASLRTELNELKTQDGQQLAERFRKAKTDLHAATQRCTALAEELDEAKTEIERLEKNAREFDEEVAGHTADAEQWKRRSDELNRKCTALKSELEEARQSASTAADSEQPLRTALEKAEAELAALKPDAARVGELQEQTNRLEAELEDLRERFKLAEEELAQERANGWKSQLAAKQAELEAAQSELRAFRDQSGAPQNTATASETAREANAPKTKGAIAPETTRGAKAPGGLEAGFEAGRQDGREQRLHFASEDAKRMLGELFVKAGIITGSQLEEALAAQKKDRPWRHLGSVLVRMGHADETQVAQAVAHQRGLEYLSLGKNSIDQLAAGLINGRLAEKHVCIPVRFDEGDLVVAMENPLDLIAIEDVERATNLRVRAAVATPTAIHAAIQTHYTSDRQRA